MKELSNRPLSFYRYRNPPIINLIVLQCVPCFSLQMLYHDADADAVADANLTHMYAPLVVHTTCDVVISEKNINVNTWENPADAALLVASWFIGTRTGWVGPNGLLLGPEPLPPVPANGLVDAVTRYKDVCFNGRITYCRSFHLKCGLNYTPTLVFTKLNQSPQ